MKLPTTVMWPDSQVLFLLIGGKDNFRQMSLFASELNSPGATLALTTTFWRQGEGEHHGTSQLVLAGRSHVPALNKTTAILFVKDMSRFGRVAIAGDDPYAPAALVRSSNDLKRLIVRIRRGFVDCWA